MQPGLPAAYIFGLVIAVAIQQPAEQEAVSQPVYSMRARLVGSDACVQCHHSGFDYAAYQVAGKEYSVWASRDPHSTAYSHLFDEQSKAIARNLKLDSAPHKNNLCLNCHATNPSNQQLALCNKHTVTDGVGCESCHGPAEQWLVPHRLPGWKDWSPSQKSSLGFVDTDNLADRARNCAACHVGSAGRDVNHDLIAAGHPRLYFEMSAYQAKMPRHWSRTEDLVQNSATAARLWLIGQYVGAAASLDLLGQRVGNASSPWPEFAEYNCVACHHNLADKHGKDEGFFEVGSKPVWGTWHFSTLDRLLKVSEQFGSAEFTLELEKLREEMQAPMPDRQMISLMTVRLRDHCDQMADYFSQTTLSGQEAVELLAPESRLQSMSWDVLMQRYLAAVALRQTQIDLRRMDGSYFKSDFEPTETALLDIRETLRFIGSYNAPPELDTTQRTRLDQDFGEILSQLKLGNPSQAR